MWQYEKKLQYPVKIKNPNPKLAQIIITQYGGPDGELGASLRYLSQRFAMPYAELKGLLTDIGTEELVHICYLLYQNVLTSKNSASSAEFCLLNQPACCFFFCSL